MRIKIPNNSVPARVGRTVALVLCVTVSGLVSWLYLTQIRYEHRLQSRGIDVLAYPADYNGYGPIGTFNELSHRTVHYTFTTKTGVKIANADELLDKNISVNDINARKPIQARYLPENPHVSHFRNSFYGTIWVYPEVTLAVTVTLFFLILLPFTVKGMANKADYKRFRKLQYWFLTPVAIPMALAMAALFVGLFQ